MEIAVIIFVCLISVVVAFIINASESDAERKIRMEKYDADMQIAREERKKHEMLYKKKYDSLISKYGEPTKTIILEKYHLDKVIYVFEEVERILICGNDLPMKDILGCTFSDDIQVVKGRITHETKTNTGSMVGRAIVGGVLTGGAGAIIGGSSAKKDTITIQENDKVFHKYTVIINVDSIASPLININLKGDRELTNEIVGLMNVIISRNN